MSSQAIALSSLVVAAICVTTIVYAPRLRRRRSEDPNAVDTRSSRTTLEIFATRLERKPVVHTGDAMSSATPSNEKHHD